MHVSAAVRVRPCATVMCESRQVRKEAAISILPVCRSKPLTGWSGYATITGNEITVIRLQRADLKSFDSGTLHITVTGHISFIMIR